ncbi:hypothetical protein RCL1_005139 [Eukaryota sp. TZLM3-RCL]
MIRPSTSTPCSPLWSNRSLRSSKVSPNIMSQFEQFETDCYEALQTNPRVSISIAQNAIAFALSHNISPLRTVYVRLLYISGHLEINDVSSPDLPRQFSSVFQIISSRLSVTHPLFISYERSLALFYKLKKEYEKAICSYQKLLSALLSSSSPDPVFLTSLYDDMGSCYLNHNPALYKEAASCLSKAFEIRKKHLLLVDMDACNSVLFLAFSLIKLECFSEAARCLNQITLYLESVVPLTFSLATLYFFRAQCDVALGDLTSALSLSIRSRDLYRNFLTESRDLSLIINYCACCNLIGWVFLKNNPPKIRDAQQNFETVLSSTKSLDQNIELDTMKTEALLGIAGIHLINGEFSKCLETCNTSQSFTSPSSYLFPFLLEQRATAQYLSSKYDDCRLTCQLALSGCISKKVKSRLYSLLGSSLQATGNVSEALVQYQNALSTFPQGTTDVLTISSNMAACFALKGDVVSAKDMLETIKIQRKEIYGEISREVAVTNRNLAVLESYTNQKASEKQLKEAIKVFEKLKLAAEASETRGLLASVGRRH